jgi:8-oxo-dGTP pyrophosphatase MutT (NUDIX family)
VVERDTLISRIAARLLAAPQSVVAEGDLVPDWLPETPFDQPPVPAAVLIALVKRPGSIGVLYTERSPDLRAHSGQVSFPGGRIDATDSSEAEAALREAWEEVGLERDRARILGYMPRYYTGTNYLITPVVAVIEPTKPFLPNPREVRSIFEVPLDMLMQDSTFTTFRINRGGKEHTTWQIRHADLTIWGITANLTRRFYDLALAAEAA